jgi:hypothetical protein
MARYGWARNQAGIFRLKMVLAELGLRRCDPEWSQTARADRLRCTAEKRGMLFFGQAVHAIFHVLPRQSQRVQVGL